MRKSLIVRLFFVLFLLANFVLSGCVGKTVVSDPVPTVDESAIAAEFIESQIGLTRMMTNVLNAAEINKAIEQNPADIKILDLRSPAAFAAGHIKGAVNVSSDELLEYYGKHKLVNLKHVVLASDSGQLGRYIQGMMWMVGCKNVYLMKWGMSSWNPAIADKHWNAAVGNDFAGQFTTKPTARNAAGALPVLRTGETEPEDILWARVEKLLATDNFFDDALVQPKDVYTNLDDFYIVNYWPKKFYAEGHIPGAVQYAIKPISELGVNRALKTLPADKKIAIYCFTGQTSALMTAYLRVLGYDAYSIAYGVNSMNYKMLKANKFKKAFVHNFPLEK